MTKTHRYSLELTWTGGERCPTSSYEAYSRDYNVAVPGKPVPQGSADPVFRGDPTLHNPEDLLVAARSGCHMLGYLALAARAGLHVVGYADSAEGSMDLAGGGGRFVEVVLRPRVTLARDGDRELAQRLHDRAHADCFIAASVNFPVRHEPTVLELERPGSLRTLAGGG